MDLDEMEVSLGYLDDWKQLIKELRAAREVVEALRLYAKRENWINGSDGKCGALACDYGHKATKALKQYDEARQG